MSLPNDRSCDDEVHCSKGLNSLSSGHQLLISQLSISTEPDENPVSKSMDSEDVDAAAPELTLIDDDTEDNEDVLIYSIER